jgi:hypothetical protein
MLAVLTNSVIGSIIHVLQESAKCLGVDCIRTAASLQQNRVGNPRGCYLSCAMCYDFGVFSCSASGGTIPEEYQFHVPFYLDGVCHFVCRLLRQLRPGSGCQAATSSEYSNRQQSKSGACGQRHGANSGGLTCARRSASAPREHPA